MLAERQNDHILVHTEFREKPLVDQVPGAKWLNEQKVWQFPLSYTVYRQLQEVFGTGFAACSGLKAWAGVEEGLARYLSELSNLDDVPFECYRSNDLSPLQRIGAAWLASAETACLADGMGSGKTVQMCATLDVLQAPRVLIVCPNGVKKVWERHLNEWTVIKPYVVRGSATQRRKIIQEFKDSPADSALIINYESLRTHSRLAKYGSIALTDAEKTPKELNGISFDVMVCDEAHRLANPKSKTTRAVWAINSRLRYALTGTPIANHPGDFWSILHYLSPREWPARSRYVDRYCDTRWAPWGSVDIVGIKPEARDEYYSLVDRYFLRRKKSDVMARVITTEHEVRYAELSTKHRKIYDTFEREHLAKIGDDAFISETNNLTANTRLVQLSAAMLDENSRMCEPSPKLDQLMELITDMQGEQLVVYSASKQLLNLAMLRLEAADIIYEIVTGDTDVALRDLAIDRFQAGQAQIFLATTGAAGEGVTLDAASTLCFLQRDYSMIKNLQANDRINRFTQKADSVTIVDIITSDTVDERVHEIFREKQRMLLEITRDES